MSRLAILGGRVLRDVVALIIHHAVVEPGARLAAGHRADSPFRYIIDTMREGYKGHYFDTIVVEGLAVAVGMAALFMWLGSRAFVRKNA